ncbi:iripin-3-like [Dermacentor variabilis]|uniref:iripin-3-like n=1 Tax=Dermacentor variabilis TaxID=34621 RepID=UPI003F5B4C21
MKVALLVLTAVSACAARNFTGLRAASNCLGLRLLSVLPRSTAPNVFYSPYSLSAAMGMVYAVSRGTTQKELYNTLGYRSAHIPKDRVLEEHITYAKNVLAPSNSTVSTTNAVVISESLQCFGDYVDTLKRAFDARVLCIDFDKNGSTVVDRINRWVFNQTRGHIKNLLESPFPRSSKLVLLNIIYFKGIWQTQFKKSETMKLPFFNDGKTPVLAETMCGRFNTSHGYSEKLSSAILDLPFQGGDYSMTIILPSRRTGVKKLRRLSLGSLQAALKIMVRRVVKVYLPRFKFETKYLLSGALAKLGLKRIFDPHRADLSGITGHRGRLHVDEVVHRAVIRVDESGGTAAAATATILRKSHSIARVFRAHHPFLFLIRKRNDNSILFVGEVNRL